MANQIFGNSHQSPGLTCRIKTGTYTGDGMTGQAITGVGFAPKLVYIFVRPTSEIASIYYMKLDTSWGDYAYAGYTTFYSYDNRINSLDADGFTVDDDGSNQNPNKLSTTYDYIVWG